MRGRHLLLVLCGIVLVIAFSTFVLSHTFSTSKTCNNEAWSFGASPNDKCDGAGIGTLDDATNDGGSCDGAESGTEGVSHVKNVILNVSEPLINEAVNATCQIHIKTSALEDSFAFVYYYNTTHWIRLNTTEFGSSVDADFNISVVFRLNNTPGTHWVRCIADGEDEGASDFCANSTTSLTDEHRDDNDDANLTVFERYNYTQVSLNITNDTVATRGLGNILASAKWIRQPSSTSSVTHNGTGSDVVYSVILDGNFTNRTLNLTNTTEFSQRGKIRLYFNSTDQHDYTNDTSYGFLFFTLNGRSNLTSIGGPTYAYVSSSQTVTCDAKDFDTGANINDLTVSFFDNRTGDFGSATNRQSGSDGVASHTLTTPSSITTLAVKCNVTDDADVFYNDTLNNTLATTISVVNLTMNASTVTPDIVFGDGTTFKFDVSGNISTIEALANVTFNNVTDAGPIQQVTTKETMVLVSSLNATYHKFELNYTPPRSGNYSVLFSAIASGRRTNITQIFNVSFGVPIVEFETPVRVFVNQTFNVTVRIRSTAGDLWNVSAKINITNQTRMNITGTSFENIARLNVTPTLSRTLTYEVNTNHTGFINFVLNATPTNGTANNSVAAAFEVMGPVIVFSINPLNVSQTILVNTTVVGNRSTVTNFYLNISKPFIASVNSTAQAVNRTVNENATHLGLRSFNAAASSNGGTASCTSGIIQPTCDTFINGDHGSLSSIASTSEINITFNATTVVEKVVFTAGSSEARTVKVFYLENEIFKDGTSFSVPTTTTRHNVTNFAPFRTTKIKVNFTGAGDVTLAEIEAHSPSSARIDKEYIYSYNFSDVNVSGRYNVTVAAEIGGRNITNSTNFTVRFGIPSLAFNLNPSGTVVEGRTIIYNVTITATFGDLRDLNVTINIPNKTVVNISNTDAGFNRTISLINKGSSERVSWNLTAGSAGTTTTFVTVNSTTQSGDFANESQTITVVATDTTPPTIESFRFNVSTTVESNKTNLRSGLIVSANITDDRSLPSTEAATTEVTYPNGTKVNKTMACPACPGGTIVTGIYNFTFNLTTPIIEIDQTGNYSVRVFGKDTENNTNVTSSKNFTVNTNYTVQVLVNQTKYNRGDNVTFRAFDTNDLRVLGVNASANVTRFEGPTITELNVTNATANEYVYKFNSSDPAGNWTVFVKTDKLGNSGNVTFTFNLSTDLNVTILNPAENTQYDTQQAIVPLEVWVKDVNNNNRTNSTTNITLTCLDSGGSNSREVLLPYSPSRGTYFHDAASNAPCFSSSSAGATFTINVKANDTSNNSKTVNRNLKTAAAASDDGGGGGGGGEGGGGGGGGAPAKEIVNQTIIIGEEVKEFDLTISEATIRLEQGGATPVTASITNKGNVPLQFSIAVAKECCQVRTIEALEVGAGEAKSFRLDVRVPLNTPPGAYVISVTASLGEKQNTKTFKIVVEESDLVVKIRELNETVSRLQSELANYKALGLDTTTLEDQLFRIQLGLINALEAIENDDEEALKSNVDRAAADVGQAELDMVGLRIRAFLKENREELTGLAVFLLIFYYLVSQIIMPYRNLTLTLKDLKKQEAGFVEARIQAEHQYFKRIIDEVTFRQIMFREQDKVVATRAKVKKTQEELHMLVRSKLNPMLFVTFYAGLILGAPARLRGAVKRALERLRGLQQKKPMAQTTVAQVVQPKAKPGLFAGLFAKAPKPQAPVSKALRSQAPVMKATPYDKTTEKPRMWPSFDLFKKKPKPPVLKKPEAVPKIFKKPEMAPVPKPVAMPETAPKPVAKPEMHWKRLFGLFGPAVVRAKPVQLRAEQRVWKPDVATAPKQKPVKADTRPLSERLFGGFKISKPKVPQKPVIAVPRPQLPVTRAQPAPMRLPKPPRIRIPTVRLRLPKPKLPISLTQWMENRRRANELKNLEKRTERTLKRLEKMRQDEERRLARYRRS